MITITQAVGEIIQKDEVALEALRADILNFSAYAQTILSEVEKRTFRSVQPGSIVVALYRLSKNIDQIPPLRPTVNIQDLSIKTSLCEVTFDRTADTLERVTLLPKEWYRKGFFTLTQGLREITIICSEQLKNQIINHFSAKPKGVYDNLVAITLSFDEEEYLEQPNMIFSLVSALAGKRINLIEVVSTFTEISFIVRKTEMNVTVEVLQQFFRSEE